MVHPQQKAGVMPDTDTKTVEECDKMAEADRHVRMWCSDCRSYEDRDGLCHYRRPEKTMLTTLIERVERLEEIVRGVQPGELDNLLGDRD